MNEPHELRARARRWLQWAHEDLAMAEAIARDATLVPRGACACAQQAAEKSLKALLIDDDLDPPKSHDLVRLNEMLRSGVTVARSDLDELSRWSIDGRYPADLDEATVADADAAIETARRILGAAAARLPVEVADDR